MSEALLLQALHATGQSLAASQPGCVGIAGRWTYEHQKQPAPLKKAACQKMLKVARLSDASNADRKSTRLNSSHDQISYAVFCLKKKNNINHTRSYDK